MAKPKPSMLNNADGVRSLPTEASVTEHDESEENIEQSSAVREAGHSLGSTTGLVNDAEQLVSGESVPSTRMADT